MGPTSYDSFNHTIIDGSGQSKDIDFTFKKGVPDLCDGCKASAVVLMSRSHVAVLMISYISRTTYFFDNCFHGQPMATKLCVNKLHTTRLLLI